MKSLRTDTLPPAIGKRTNMKRIILKKDHSEKVKAETSQFSKRNKLQIAHSEKDNSENKNKTGN